MWKVYLKDALQNSPQSLGKLLCKVPFPLRFGPSYKRTVSLVDWATFARPQDVGDWQLNRILNVSLSASETIPYFSYLAKGDSSAWNSFVESIPLLAKTDLRAIALQRRSRNVRGRYLTNTGGTSGSPLSFYLDRYAFAREWAHMHAIWRRIGYSWRDKKLTFRGKNLGTDVVRYNPIHNEYVVNSYIGWPRVAREIERIVRKEKISFIHGYPSLISDFARYVLESDHSLHRYFKDNPVGVLLGSEFPAPPYRELIKRLFGSRIQAWYGHSEMAVLAFEVDENVYEVMPTYGVAEAVYDGSISQYRLIATSLWNDVSPFVRYDTGDTVKPISYYDDGVRLSRFGIDNGRVGDFVVDKNGHNIALTGLIFGRHHPVFAIASFIQVSQKKLGSMEIHVTIEKNESDLNPEQVANLMDMTGIDMNVTYHVHQAPFRTGSGKIPLKLAE